MRMNNLIHALIRFGFAGIAGTAMAQIWQPQNSSTANSLSSVHFVSSDIGWAVGAVGTILKTVNGGATWTPQTSGTPQTLNSIHFPPRARVMPWVRTGPS